MVVLARRFWLEIESKLTFSDTDPPYIYISKKPLKITIVGFQIITDVGKVGQKKNDPKHNLKKCV